MICLMSGCESELSLGGSLSTLPGHTASAQQTLPVSLLPCICILELVVFLVP